ncbi:MAG: hypothetical protein K0R92_1116 [Lachnospiraceae bacterium]|jgi:uncharacterized SAM-binding protein YcdF (DUF218 family)|nr:hypothetical protein [Lachnospiraceae bacterium]
MNIIAGMFLILGILSLVYVTAIILYAGLSTAFVWFWITLGICSIGLAFLLRIVYTRNIEIPKFIKLGFMGVLLLGIFIFLLTVAVIMKQGSQVPAPGADYVIVLGAQVRGTALSKALKNRLDTAYGYIVDNPDCIVIVSGGQGSGEDISEAEAMSRYLISKGIHKNRIIKEDKSTNTNENIYYSKAFMKTDTKTTVIVTSRFHVYRAIQIAKKQGLEQIQGLGAPTDDILALSYYVREFLAVIKDRMVGNI